ncbi:MAG: hypothetical protein K6357_06925 [Elusimicrobiota bacterium]
MKEENLKRKEDKKKGFLAWLREKLGFSPRGGMGNLSQGPRDINLAGLRGAGSAARFGAGVGRFGAGGAFSFLGGKAGIITAALIALAVGTTLYYKNNSMGDANMSASMGDSSKIASYVPKILREQSNASTLGMFDKSGIKDEDDIANKEEVKDESTKADESEQVKENLNPDLGFDNKPNLQFGDKPRLQTDMQFGLSSSIGGDGNNKFSALGGFGNHMGKFGPSVKGDFSKNDLLKNLKKSANSGKLSAMKSQKRPIIAQGTKFQSAKGGKRAFDQAKAIKSMQMQPNYGKADTARATMDKAWEGGTGSGDVGAPSGGTGISDGGSGLVQTPSTLDNIGDTTAGGVPDNNVPSTPNYKFDTPWASLIQKAMMMLMISALLAGIASMVAKIKPWGMIVAVGLALAAAALAVMVIMIGMKLMKEFGQQKLGMLYVIGGGLAIAAAVASIAGVWVSWAALLAKILAAGAGIIGMLASMAAGPAAQDYANKQMEEQQSQTSKTNTSSSYQRFIG